jgi:signal transduction histidine kinase
VGAQETGKTSEHECLVAVRRAADDALAFRVRAAPLNLRGHELVVVTLTDIRDQKRREALEATFLHDFLTAVSALRGAAQMLPKAGTEAERCALAQKVMDVAERLQMDIAEQGELARVESGSFETHVLPIRVGEVLDRVRRFFDGHEVTNRKALHVAEDTADITVDTDSVLIKRALANLVKNALEATAQGGKVRLWCEAADGHAVFHVWNAENMPPEVAERVFQRYFSTKEEKGRGLGTYTARLIVERYLGGSIDFSTSPTAGTDFQLRVPLQITSACNG